MRKHAKFFTQHKIDGIPEKFVQRIGALQSCKLVRSVTAVMEKLKKLESGTKNHLKIMVSQARTEEGRILFELSMQGVELSIIVGHNTIFTDETVEMVAKFREKVPANERTHNKMVEKVDVALYIADGQAAVMFPNTTGEIDMNALFLGSDVAFYEWCNDVFHHYWERAGYFDIKKTTRV